MNNVNNENLETFLLNEKQGEDVYYEQYCLK